jgi:hypothetical protein
MEEAQSSGMPANFFAIALCDVTEDDMHPLLLSHEIEMVPIFTAREQNAYFTKCTIIFKIIPKEELTFKYLTLSYV